MNDSERIVRALRYYLAHNNKDSREFNEYTRLLDEYEFRASERYYVPVNTDPLHFTNQREEP